MPLVRIECDQHSCFLKPHSEIENGLEKHGRLDARKIADLAVGPDPVIVEVADSARAHELVETLNQLSGVSAHVVE